MPVVNHIFVSAKPDAADASLVRPSNWNDTHKIVYNAQNITGADTLDVTKDVARLQAGTYPVVVPLAAGTKKQILVAQDGAGTITLTPSGADTIGGQLTVSLSSIGSSCILVDEAVGIWGLVLSASTTTLARAYSNGSSSAQQTLALLDTAGGGLVIDGTAVGFTGTSALTIKGSTTTTVTCALNVLGGTLTPTSGNTILIGNINQADTIFQPPSGTAAFAALSLAYEFDQTHTSGNINGLLINTRSLAVTGLVNNAYLINAFCNTISGTSLFLLRCNGSAALLQSAVDSILPPASLRIASASNTNITASTESLIIDFDFTNARQWASGNITTQRDFLVRASTYAFIGASTVTTAATLAITGAPTAGSNATITNPLALWVQSGRTQLDGGSYTSTSGTQHHLGLTATFVPTSGTALFQPFSLSYTVNQTGGANGTVTGIFVNATETAVGGTHNLLDLEVGSVSRFKIDRFGDTTISQASFASGGVSATALTVTGGAVTGLPATTEVFGTNVNLSATKQWATGNIATQRDLVVQASTYAFVGASTVTTGATMAITGPPSAGTNATITTPLALWIQSGDTLFAGNATVQGVLSLSDGSLASPSMTFTADPATGFLHTGGSGSLSQVVASIGGIQSFYFGINTPTGPVSATPKGSLVIGTAGVVGSSYFLHTQSVSALLPSGFGVYGIFGPVNGANLASIKVIARGPQSVSYGSSLLFLTSSGTSFVLGMTLDNHQNVIVGSQQYVSDAGATACLAIGYSSVMPAANTNFMVYLGADLDPGGTNYALSINQASVTGTGVALTGNRKVGIVVNGVPLWLIASTT